jgi:hypothetical protein
MRSIPLIGYLLLLAHGVAGPAHNTVFIENQSNKPWRVECMRLDEGYGSRPPTAGLVVSRLDVATGEYVVQKPEGGVSFTLPEQGRLALDTKAPLDSEQEMDGAWYQFRLQDEAGHCDPGSSLYYNVSWYYACSRNAPCRLGRSVRLGACGDLMKKVVGEVSPTELHIVADFWPLPEPAVGPDGAAR